MPRTPRKVARNPSRRPDGPRTHVHHVHVTDDEYSLIGTLSALAGMKMSHYVRCRSLTPPIMRTGEAEPGDCGALDELSARLNPHMKAANMELKKNGGNETAASMRAVAAAAALVLGFEESGWRPAPLPAAAGAPAGGRGPGSGKSARVSASGFLDDLGRFSAAKARDEALALLRRDRTGIVAAVSGGLPVGTLVAAANSALRLAYGGRQVRVTAADVRTILGDDVRASAAGGRSRRGGGQARTRRVFLIVNGPESAEFRSHRETAGMRMAAYVRRCCIQGPPVCVPPANLDAYVRLSRLTSNLTQLSFRVEGGARAAVRSARKRVGSFRLGLLGIG
ncbi:MAG: hypothetical protein LBR80_12115 [Deltaproteobacteria bacterium]|jgi:hypothetical protein|nr:hypothetical protein [Deltaproteobacteria bacterium]